MLAFVTDVCLEPPLARFTSTDLRAYERIVEIGERTVTESMPAIRRVLGSAAAKDA